MPVRVSSAALRLILLPVTLLYQTGSAADEKEPLLPLVATDVVVRRDALPGQTQKLTGVIEELTGERVQLRRSAAGRVELINLRDVVQLSFSRSAEYERGLRKMQERDWKAALFAFDSAAALEPRRWVVREIQASGASALLALGRRQEVLSRIEKIFADDPDTRHVMLLPLVWDERLPDDERFPGQPADLDAPSELRQLAGASALLQNPSAEAAAVATLTRLRTSSRPRIQELSEVQLWRVRLIHPESLRNADISLWRSRSPDFHGTLRSGAEALLGRALALRHDYDLASLSLLWAPLMSSDDHAFAASCFADAVVALRTSGRAEDAARIHAELQDRFPNTSSARRMVAAGE